MTQDVERLCYERCRRKAARAPLGVCSVLCNALGYFMPKECPEAVETHRHAAAALRAEPPHPREEHG